jgi:hypothetical protein
MEPGVRVAGRRVALGATVGRLVGVGLGVGVTEEVGVRVGSAVSVGCGVQVGGKVGTAAIATVAVASGGGLKGLSAIRGLTKINSSAIANRTVTTMTTRVAI